MSNYERGKAFEIKVAAMTRRKLDSDAKRDKASHKGWRRSDIYTTLPLHIEVKDHVNVKVKEWFQQALDASRVGNKTPVLVYRMDPEVMASLRYDDLLNLMVEIADLRAEVQDLKAPINQTQSVKPITTPLTFKNEKELKKYLKKPMFATAAQTCRNGHIIPPGRSGCQWKGCVYNSTYKAKKRGKK